MELAIREAKARLSELIAAARSLEAPIEHKDPFDELLLVQAREERLRLLTRDRRLADHPLAVGANAVP